MAHPLLDHQIVRFGFGGGITPFNLDQVNPASYNLTIGNTAKIETRDGFQHLDLSRYSMANPYNLGPGGFILTDVNELIAIPPDMEAQVVLRSSAARRGWDHCLAGYVDPGYGFGRDNASRLTLEFKNCLRYGFLPIFPGLQLVQLRLFKLDDEPLEHYGKTGRYGGAQTVEGCKDTRLW